MENDEISEEKLENPKQISPNPNLMPWRQGQTPSVESKKAGWAKRRRNRELFQFILDQKFHGEGMLEGFKKSLKQYFNIDDDEIKDLTNEAVIILKMVGMAIERGDMTAAQTLFDRAYGKPKEFNPMTDGEEGKPIINITVVDNAADIKEVEDDNLQSNDLSESSK